MAKFFVDTSQIIHDEITIIGSDVNHIKNVLRLESGKKILINDRQGQDYHCIIRAIHADRVIAQIVEIDTIEVEPVIDTYLFQSLIKGEKMELVLQKSVEIGVTKIIPIMTERCVVKFESENKLERKIERWQKIAESAAKQSKRGIIPEVKRPLTFKEAIVKARNRATCCCMPYENEKAYHIKSYLQSLENIKSIGIFIGPEGGFTKEEVTYAIRQGITPITLGKRILRSETAGIVTLANIIYEMGDV